MKTASWIICSVILAIFLLLQWQAPALFKTDTPTASESGKALIGGSFSLVDHHNKPFTDKDLLGKYSLIYFGFTYCPDICPTSLLIITNALNELGNKADQITPVLISVDPERDTPEVLADYVANFHPSLIGLTGTPEQVKKAAQAYKVYYQKVEQPDSEIDYLVDHSGYIFLMNPQGEYVTHYTHDISVEELVASLRQYLK